MKIFYVSYDVRDGGDYEKLISKLRELGGRNILRSTWSLKLSEVYEVNNLLDELLETIAENENTGIIVIEAIAYDSSNLDCDPYRF